MNQPATRPEPLLSVDDLTPWLRRPRTYIYRTRHEGRPPGSLAIRVGGTLRWRREVIDEWLTSREGDGRNA